MLTTADIDELVRPDLGRVHASVYTDPQIFHEEIRRIFYRTWNYVGHESEVAEAGDYKTAYVGLVPVIVARDEDRDLHVLVNRCVHRGPTVCQWESGNSSYFRCEYHGWTYRNDGRLVGVTLRNGYADAEFEGISQSLGRVPRVATYRGLIFACLDPGVESLEENLGIAKEYLDAWSDQSPTGNLVVTGGVWKRVYDGNWKLGLEGSAESYHARSLHKILGVMTEHRTGKPFRWTDSAQSGLANKDAGHGHAIIETLTEQTRTTMGDSDSSEYIAALNRRLGEERTREVLGRAFRLHLFPNVAFGPEHIRVFRPIAADRTEVRQYHVALPDIAGVTEETNRQRVRNHQQLYGPAGYVGEDDFEIFSRAQEGLGGNDWDQLNPWVWFSLSLIHI